MTEVKREHLAGLEMALESGAVTSPDMRESVRKMIAQASAAPEQEPIAWLCIETVRKTGEEVSRVCYPGGYMVPLLPDLLTNAVSQIPLYTHPSAEIERLGAELADAQALLRDAFTHRTYYERHAMYDRIDAYLSATAQPAEVKS